MEKNHDLFVPSPESVTKPEFYTPLRRVYTAAQLDDIYGAEVLKENRAARVVSQSEVDSLEAKAQASPRRRAVIPVTSPFDSIQKFYNGILPDSYVRPHMHLDEWEYFEVIKGKLSVVFLSEAGEPQQIIELGGAQKGLDIPPGQIHTVMNNEFAAIFEVKPGPYLVPIDKESVLSSRADLEVSPQVVASDLPLYVEAKPKHFLASSPAENDTEAGLAYLAAFTNN